MYQFSTKVRYTETDLDGKLTIPALMDYFQDCSVFQSESLGVGIEHLEKTKTAWILNSWQICINKMPSLGDEIFVQTWPYDMKGFFGYRNFQIVDKEGNVLAFANTVWIYVNTETGRPLRIPQELMDIYVQEPPIEMECGERKMTAPEEYVEKESLVVPKYFIDTNHHMNNSKYALVAMRYTEEEIGNNAIQEVRVEYKKEALLGNVMIPRVTKLENEVDVNLVDQNGKSYSIVKFLLKK